MNPEAGLYLYTGNQLETLFEELAGVLSEPLPSVLQPETVVVQSLGMQRWLSLQLAGRLGICANVRFPFPRRFLSEVFRHVLPESPEDNRFERETMTWCIMRILPQMVDRPEFEAVRNYLGGERPGLKRFQLASRIAETFDEYVAFRPEMVLGWDVGLETHWQATLWRELGGPGEKKHLPALRLKLAEKLRRDEMAPRTMPARISIFGISTMPGFYLGVLEELSRYVAVHLFVMEPTPQWWQDIVSAREEAKILKSRPDRTVEELHLERGNTLLASMGKLGRDFLGFLADLDGAIHRESFVEPVGGTILASIQDDIFALREPERKSLLPEEDRSFQVHSCHSPMREVEVLHDQLLALFSDRPDLQPQDVVVMMPDVATYAPLIEAVFDTPEIPKHRIPFSIADRTARAEGSIINTFLAVLELAHSRFGASSLLDILDSPSVQRRFGLAEGELEIIRIWLEKAAIRWGIDVDHRKRLGLPDFPNNTWREGLDRLLLGYAMAGENAELFKGILPCDEIEGGFAETLGNFIEFASRIFDTAEEMEIERTLGEWQLVLREIVERFFEPTEEGEREVFQIRSVLGSLEAIGEASGFNEPIDLEVLLAVLRPAFGNAVSNTGFLSGAVTFCTLKPMRSIPFKVVCILGMSDTAYPRRPQTTGFDLIAQNPRRGDRSIRDDDRYLFLEALLSVREVFYLSYVGQSIKDNSILAPSVLVTELLDYLDRAFETPKPKSVLESLVTRHPLHPFHSSYFGENRGRTFSYSLENCRAGEAGRAERSDPPPFLAGPVSQPEEEWRTVDVDGLIRFFRNPAKFFVMRRLGITLPGRESAPEEREPFELDGLARYRIEQDLLRKALKGENLDGQLPLILASGQLPHGHRGTNISRQLCADMEAFAEIVTRHLNSKATGPVSIDRKIGDWTLSGRIDGVSENGLISYRPAPLRAKDMLRVWIAHLALNCIKRSQSVLIGKGSMQTYEPVDNGATLLEELLALYWEGLRRPLRFFSEASYALAEANSRRENDPLKMADDALDKTESDPYIDLAFRNTGELLDSEFQDVAMRIFAPLIDSRLETDLSL